MSNAAMRNEIQCHIACEYALEAQCILAYGRPKRWRRWVYHRYTISQWLLLWKSNVHEQSLSRVRYRPIPADKTCGNDYLWLDHAAGVGPTIG